MRGEKFSFPEFFSNNPILATICAIFLIADIILLDHIITDRNHQKEIGRYRNEISGLQAASQQMNDKYNKLNEMYNVADRMNKELELRDREIQAKNDSQISSLTSNLKICQETNLNFIDRIKKQDSETASLHDREEKLDALEKLFARQLVLGPIWIKAGEVAGAFGGDVAVTVDDSSDKGQCPKGAAIVHLGSGGDKRDLCLQMDRPQSLTYKGKKLLLYLLGVKESEPPHQYLVAIVKER